MSSHQPAADSWLDTLLAGSLVGSSSTNTMPQNSTGINLLNLGNISLSQPQPQPSSYLDVAMPPSSSFLSLSDHVNRDILSVLDLTGAPLSSSSCNSNAMPSIANQPLQSSYNANIGATPNQVAAEQPSIGHSAGRLNYNVERGASLDDNSSSSNNSSRRRRLHNITAPSSSSYSPSTLLTEDSSIVQPSQLLSILDSLLTDYTTASNSTSAHIDQSHPSTLDTDFALFSNQQQQQQPLENQHHQLQQQRRLRHQNGSQDDSAIVRQRQRQATTQSRRHGHSRTRSRSLLGLSTPSLQPPKETQPNHTRSSSVRPRLRTSRSLLRQIHQDKIHQALSHPAANQTVNDSTDLAAFARDSTLAKALASIDDSHIAYKGIGSISVPGASLSDSSHLSPIAGILAIPEFTSQNSQLSMSAIRPAGTSTVSAFAVPITPSQHQLQMHQQQQQQQQQQHQHQYQHNQSSSELGPLSMLLAAGSQLSTFQSGPASLNPSASTLPTGDISAANLATIVPNRSSSASLLHRRAASSGVKRTAMDIATGLGSPSGTTPTSHLTAGGVIAGNTTVSAPSGLDGSLLSGLIPDVASGAHLLTLASSCPFGATTVPGPEPSPIATRYPMRGHKHSRTGSDLTPLRASFSGQSPASGATLASMSSSSGGNARALRNQLGLSGDASTGSMLVSLSESDSNVALSAKDQQPQHPQQLQHQSHQMTPANSATAIAATAASMTTTATAALHSLHSPYAGAVLTAASPSTGAYPFLRGNGLSSFVPGRSSSLAVISTTVPPSCSTSATPQPAVTSLSSALGGFTQSASGGITTADHENALMQVSLGMIGSDVNSIIPSNVSRSIMAVQEGDNEDAEDEVGNRELKRARIVSNSLVNNPHSSSIVARNSHGFSSTFSLDGNKSSILATMSSHGRLSLPLQQPQIVDPAHASSSAQFSASASTSMQPNQQHAPASSSASTALSMSMQSSIEQFNKTSQQQQQQQQQQHQKYAQLPSQLTISTSNFGMALDNGPASAVLGTGIARPASISIPPLTAGLPLQNMSNHARNVSDTDAMYSLISQQQALMTPSLQQQISADSGIGLQSQTLQLQPQSAAQLNTSSEIAMLGLSNLGLPAGLGANHDKVASQNRTVSGYPHSHSHPHPPLSAVNGSISTDSIINHVRTSSLFIPTSVGGGGVGGIGVGQVKQHQTHQPYHMDTSHTLGVSLDHSTGQPGSTPNLGFEIGVSGVKTLASVTAQPQQPSAAPLNGQMPQNGTLLAALAQDADPVAASAFAGGVGSDIGSELNVDGQVTGTSGTTERRLMRRRERNRIAARRSREKRNHFMRELEESVQMLQKENMTLRRQVAHVAQLYDHVKKVAMAAGVAESELAPSAHLMSYEVGADGGSDPINLGIGVQSQLNPAGFIDNTRFAFYQQQQQQQYALGLMNNTDLSDVDDDDNDD